LLAFLVGALVMPVCALAQAGGGGGGGGGGGNRGNRGNFDPAAMRQRFMDNIKEQLGASEDEWKVMSPKIEKVMTAQRETRGGGMFGGGRGGRGGGNNPPADQPQSKIAQAQQDLRTAVENKSTPPEELTKKLTALREARDKADAELAAAQKELKEVCTVRQEAVLVMMGQLK
jgi:hypothetical protein